MKSLLLTTLMFLSVYHIGYSQQAIIPSQTADSPFPHLQFKGECKILGNPDVIIGEFDLDSISNPRATLRAIQRGDFGVEIVTEVIVGFIIGDSQTLTFLTKVEGDERAIANLGQVRLDSPLADNRLSAVLPIRLNRRAECSGLVL